MKMMRIDTRKQNVFFTSDTHFSHFNIIRYCERPYSNTDEMDDDLIKRWNERVGKNDIVFHLGDFGMVNQKKLEEIAGRLNGRIYFVRGNHDRPWNTDGMFELVRDRMTVNIDEFVVVMSHYPLLCHGGEMLDGRRMIQLYGHIHSRKSMSLSDKLRITGTSWNQYDVGVDNNDYTPVSFDEIVEKIKQRRAKEKGLWNSILNKLIDWLYLLKR